MDSLPHLLSVMARQLSAAETELAEANDLASTLPYWQERTEAAEERVQVADGELQEHEKYARELEERAEKAEEQRKNWFLNWCEAEERAEKAERERDEARAQLAVQRQRGSGLDARIQELEAELADLRVLKARYASMRERAEKAEALALRLDTNLNFGTLYADAEARIQELEAALRDIEAGPYNGFEQCRAIARQALAGDEA